jgi:hypothetical protein
VRAGWLLSIVSGRAVTRLLSRLAAATGLRTLEFQVHGMFKMAADGRPFPDTYYLTIRELSESGLSKAYIKQSMGCSVNCWAQW